MPEFRRLAALAAADAADCGCQGGTMMHFTVHLQLVQPVPQLQVQEISVQAHEPEKTTIPQVQTFERIQWADVVDIEKADSDATHMDYSEVSGVEIEKADYDAMKSALNRDSHIGGIMNGALKGDSSEPEVGDSLIGGMMNGALKGVSIEPGVADFLILERCRKGHSHVTSLMLRSLRRQTAMRLARTTLRLMLSRSLLNCCSPSKQLRRLLRYRSCKFRNRWL